MAALGEHALPQRLFQGCFAIPLRHAPPTHLHNERLEPVAGLRSLGPYLRALWCLWRQALAQARGGDGGDHAQWLCDWVRSVKLTHTMAREVVEHTGKGLQVVQHRWKVERTFAWLLNDRRHRRDYERLTVSRAVMIQIRLIRLLLKRWA